MSGGQNIAISGDTIPELLIERGKAQPHRSAIREKDFGIWQSWTWEQVCAEVRAFACGLSEMGLARGDKVAILGDNRPRLYWAMAAVQSMGGVPVPVYQDAIADEVSYVLSHAEIRFAVLENQEQVDKVLSVRENSPALEGLIYTDPRGMRNYKMPFLHGFEDVVERGRKHDAAQANFFDGEVAKGKGSDLAIILYTSGTTGRPKGVMLSYDNIVITARNANRVENVREDEEVLAYLPMAWVGDHIFSYAQALIAGFTVSCPESSDTLMLDLRELGPTFFFAPPRVFENILTTVVVRMEDASALKRWMFTYFMEVARRSGTNILEGKPVPLGDRLLYAMGKVLVYGPLRNTLGFTRLRRAYTAGEAIGPETFNFYRSLGINLKQLYGQTEASVYVTIQPDNEVKLETVGKAAPDCEIKIADNGEVLYRSPGVFLGYYQNDDATAETKTADGWVHTGDAGVIDEDGHLKIIDRAKDVGRLANGTLFAPKYLENKLKFLPAIREAVAFGDGSDYATAMINIDIDAVGNWAERQGISYTSYIDLADHDKVYELVAGGIRDINANLAKDPNLAGSAIRRFLILHKELDADDGELTRTRKVRRGFIAERYGTLVDALYSNATSVTVEAAVVFEDGRKGKVKADLKIRNVDGPVVAEPLRKAG